MNRRQACLGLLATAALGAGARAVHAQTSSAAAPLDLLADWVGGKWVYVIEQPNAPRVTLTRVYQWSFDRRVLIGRSFGEREGKTVQTREALFFWNADLRRIEMIDHIDTGGYGAGFIEARESPHGQLYMEARIVGNAKHPDWRAWMKASATEQTIKVEARKGDAWTDFGTWPYKRVST